MRIKILVSMVGSKPRFIGDILEVPKDLSEEQAQRLIKTGFAEEIEAKRVTRKSKPKKKESPEQDEE